jgi:hypothetical protein
VTGMSFRFKVVRDSWADNKGNEIKDRSELVELLYGGDKKRGPLQRTIKEVKLMEAGPVVFPAYPQTTVGVRSEMNDDERRQRLEDLAHEGAGDLDEERGNEATVSLREVMDELGMTDEEIVEYLRAFPPKKGEEKPKPGDKAADPKKPCTCDKVEGKHTVGDHKKTSSDPKAKAGSEKKSEDDTSVAPEEGADAAEPRSEDQDDAAQAGTSTGMTKNARERALSLLDLI